jgi:hypothetical protein
MDKNSFINNSEVKSFVDWMSDHTVAKDEVLHCWISKSNKAAEKKGVSVKFYSLIDAFSQYYWVAKNPLTGERIHTFDDNASCLSELGAKLDIAISSKDEKKCFEYCKKTLEWGGVLRYSSNLAITIQELNGTGLLPEYLSNVRTYLRAVVDPNEPFKFSKNNKKYPLDVDSGTTKIYSLLSNDWIIYDGRVGSALGFLVLKWAMEKNENQVPEQLCFAHAREPHRNPNRSDQKIFPVLVNDSSRLAHNLYANWLIQEIVAKNKSTEIMRNVEKHSHPRALEAALFMLGYSIRSE